MSRVVCIIQARIGSAQSRLYRKVLSDIGGKPMLARVIDRCLKAKLVDEVVLLTPRSPANDELVGMNGLPTYRGDDTDVLIGYHGAALQHHADIICRITADCPLVDGGTIDDLIRLRDCCEADYASNEGDCLGFDAEVFTWTELDKAFTMAYEWYDRVHVTPFIRRSRDNRQIAFKSKVRPYRLCVDEEADLEMVRRIVSRLGPDCTSDEIFKLLDAEPNLICNAHVRQKAVEEG